jgi:hypothetical protein
MKDDPKNHAKRLGQIPFATKAKAIVEARRPEVGGSAIGAGYICGFAMSEVLPLSLF